MHKNSPATATADTITQTTTETLRGGVADLKKTVATATGYSEQTVAGVREMTAFNTDTLAAVTQANHILVAGSQNLYRQFTDSGQAAFAETLAGYRALGSAKTIKDGFEVQANMIRTSFGWMTECLRLAQASLDLALKASVPLTARATQAVEKLATQAP
jgi:hypothetical protein